MCNQYNQEPTLHFARPHQTLCNTLLNSYKSKSYTMVVPIHLTINKIEKKTHLQPNQSHIRQKYKVTMTFLTTYTIKLQCYNHTSRKNVQRSTFLISHDEKLLCS